MIYNVSLGIKLFCIFSFRFLNKKHINNYYFLIKIEYIDIIFIFHCYRYQIFNGPCLFCLSACCVVSWKLYFSFKMTILSTLCRKNTLSSLINKSAVIKLFRSDQNAFKQGCKFCQIKYICYDLVIYRLTTVG